MVLDPIPRSLPVHFLGSRPQPLTSPLKVEYLKLGTIEMLTRKRHACQLLVIFVSRTNDYSTSLCHSNRLSQKSACCTIAKDCDSLLKLTFAKACTFAIVSFCDSLTFAIVFCVYRALLQKRPFAKETHDFAAS